MKRNKLDDVFKKEGKWLKVYQGVETVDDPYEKNVSVTELNPLPIKVIITDVPASKMVWKVPGLIVAKAKEVYFKKHHRNLIENSQRFEFENDSYVGYRQNGKLQIEEQDDYLKLLIYNVGVTK